MTIQTGEQILPNYSKLMQTIRINNFRYNPNENLLNYSRVCEVGGFVLNRDGNIGKGWAAFLSEINP
jgi:hypothetical protein